MEMEKDGMTMMLIWMALAFLTSKTMDQLTIKASVSCRLMS